MKNILFIGGTGLISTAVSELAIEKGFNLTLLNRGNKNYSFKGKVNEIICDINDEKAVKEKLKDLYFDAVVEWIAFTKEHVMRDYRIFKGHTAQYVFISTASAYQKPLPYLPITEDIPLDNPYWGYSQNKKICEAYLLSLNDDHFPVTIIRPSHTYNDQSIVSQLNSWTHPYTLLRRMKEHQTVIMPDQGKAYWTLTYNKDFAHAFLDVLGNPKTYNNFYHLTSDKSYQWLELFDMLKKAVGSKSELIFIPKEVIAKKFPDYYGSILGDMGGSAIFDNSKIKEVAPNYVSKTEYSDIVDNAVLWFMNHPEYQTIDEDFDRRYNELIEQYKNN